MKRLRKKSGFTLVECVVAMALLAIMTLMLAMMMNIIVTLRNDNQNEEKGIDQQVEDLVNEKNIEKEALSESHGKIDFKNGISISGGNKVYVDGSSAKAQIGAIDYEFDDESIKPDKGEGEGDKDPSGTPEEKDNMSYGASSVKDNKVSIYEPPELKKEETIETKTGPKVFYNVTWEISFVAEAGSFTEEKAVKVALPQSAQSIKDVTVPSAPNQYRFYCLSENIVRIEATTNNKEYKWSAERGNYVVSLPPVGYAGTTVDVNFTIEKDEYDKFGSLAGYFQGKYIEAGNKVIIDLNS